MTRTAIVVEIEGLLFETDAIRHGALREALAAEGVHCHAADIQRAHAGVPAAVALRALAGSALDDTGESLVLRRTADRISEAFAQEQPRFSPSVRDHLLSLAAEHAIGVVTRATQRDARWMIESIGLDACIGTVCSLSEVNASRSHASWADAVTRLHADRGVACAPPAMLPDAVAAGLRTLDVTGLATVSASGRNFPFTLLDGEAIAALFPSSNVC